MYASYFTAAFPQYWLQNNTTHNTTVSSQTNASHDKELLSYIQTQRLRLLFQVVVFTPNVCICMN